MNNEIGIFDPEGINNNPLTNKSYSAAYKTLAKIWSTYPVYQKRGAFMKTIEKNQLIIAIVGTGGGKTALIPKYALHWTGYDGNVIVSLPKRKVTESAANYAAKTLDVVLGEQVGYAFKGSPGEMLNDKNKIVYMTDGLLIMKFIQDPLLSSYKVVIIDEAHERKIQIDILLLLLKKLLLSGKRPDLKVIIMSATIDSNKYVDYFRGTKSDVIEIEGKPNYPIETVYLKEPTRSYMQTGQDILFDIIDKKDDRDVIFFVTTKNETKQVCNAVKNRSPDTYCIEFYSGITAKASALVESKDAFKSLPQKYQQKIITATNAAESSITIEGLKYVIDSCYELYSYFNPNIIGHVIEKRLITNAQALQRRGRVGRTEPGICYHLLTETQFNMLIPYPEPDILNQDITIDILKIIQITPEKSFQSAIQMCKQLMDPPHNDYIDVSERLLRTYDAIDNNGYITKTGVKISMFSSLPLNRIMFMIYAFGLKCGKEACYIVASLEATGGKLENYLRVDETRLKSIDKYPISKFIQKKSDHLTFYKIFESFDGSSNKKAWCQEYMIRQEVMYMIADLGKKYFYKLLSFAKNPNQFNESQTGGFDSTRKRLIKALKDSHQHQTEINFMPTFVKVPQLDAKISNTSVVKINYKTKELQKKRAIYDNLTRNNGIWEYSVMTLL